MKTGRKITLTERLSLLSAFKDQYSKICSKRQFDSNWIKNEQQSMVNYLNQFLINPVDIDYFCDKIESQALGHSDYLHKLALYSVFEIERQNDNQQEHFILP